MSMRRTHAVAVDSSFHTERPERQSAVYFDQLDCVRLTGTDSTVGLTTTTTKRRENSENMTNRTV